MHELNTLPYEGADSREAAGIKGMARAQRILAWAIVVSVVGTIGYFVSLPFLGRVLAGRPYMETALRISFWVMMGGMQMGAVVCAMRALGCKVWMTVLGAIISVWGWIGLLVMVIIFQQFAASLRRSGVRVRLFGGVEERGMEL